MPSTPALPDTIAPPLSLFLREAMQVANWRRAGVTPGAAKAASVGRNRPVLVIPGFLASDTSTRPLRLALRQAGFRAHGWKRGRNFGLKSDIFDRIDERLDQIAPGGTPVSIVGWSLGGLIAREYAKRAPDRVDRVVTLGTPFSGDIRANNVWRLYEIIAGHKVDRPPVDCALAEKPPVETIAIWSRQDGVVAAACARGLPTESDRQIEVGCGHIEFTFQREAIDAVVQALA
jgi:pimeloyl-ACP methyl ester carboxylesterase